MMWRRLATSLAWVASRQAAVADDAPRFTRCSGTSGLVPEATWTQVKETAHSDTYGREFGIIVDPRSDIFESFRDILDKQVFPDLNGAVEDCVFGVVALLLLSLPLVDQIDGLRKSREHRALADDLYFKFSEFLEDSEWPLDISQHYGSTLLLGDEATDCAGSSLKIYIYNSTSDLTKRKLRTAFGMMGAATHVHTYFERSTCTTTDPDEADFFLIPAYHGDQYDEFLEKRIHQDDVLEYFPYLERRLGMDHFFVVSANLPDWRNLDPVKNAALLTVESYQVNDGIPRWYSPWKDIMIPGYIDRWRIAAMRSFSKPTEERGYVMVFHGNHPGTHHLYVKHKATIRTQILDTFAGIADCSVGGPTPDFFERMGRSHFCLVPRGSSAWTIHLYESFFFGCIPVILSDDFEMPFQELVDWPSLSLKWPEARVDMSLLEHLRAIPLEKVAEMKRRLEEAACFFDFHAGWGSAPQRPAGADAADWAYRGMHKAAMGSDCPYVGLGDAASSVSCRKSCDQEPKCTVVNYQAGHEGEVGSCVLRACADPAQPSLVVGAAGWEVWARLGKAAHYCSPFAGILRALEAKVRTRPFSHGPHWF
eukprot:TRINITY_DN44677_c0_g1_i1.p1 TRINITY_DN44677_c0_g1~~TRINITY_DN44677_c0_g1_i1.p1  ORF type:complete len:593 (-),score=119.64 TRINITY_DN44677_c0_g1_i1:28-1806(-)